MSLEKHKTLSDITKLIVSIIKRNYHCTIILTPTVYMALILNFFCVFL